MKHTRDALRRFYEMLDALDDLADDALDDLNAELEDALALLEETDPEDEPEDYADTLETIRALAADYRATGVRGVEALAEKLEAEARDQEQL